MSSEVRIREAVAADDAAVGELLVEAFVSRYARKMPEVVVTPQRKDELRDVAGKRAVATGGFTREQLVEAGATRAFDTLASPGALDWLLS